MALTTCKDCGHKVSTRAAACTNCGAVRKPGTTWFTKLAAGFVALTSAAIVWSIAAKDDQPKTLAASPEQAASSAKAEAPFQDRVTASRAFAKAIRQAARDPESVSFDTVRANDDGTTLCAEYRARNGFGGMNRSVAVLSGRALHFDKATVWNKHCTTPLHDMTRLVR